MGAAAVATGPTLPSVECFAVRARVAFDPFGKEDHLIVASHFLVPLSVLDLSPIGAGGTAAESFRNTLDLARHAERLGYRRFWLAEHHGIPGVASAATAVLIAHVAGGTTSIRVGSGGIMLPNHAPLVVAEQFGTLESLFPGRIDLGLGRAPGGDLRTATALRRHTGRRGDDFAEDLAELMAYFQPGSPGQCVHAIPGEGLNVPIWILGSSDYGARLAARLGLPFAFASHFAPDHLHVALELYRSEFRPSEALERPHAMVAVNVVAADTDAAAVRLFTSLQQAFLNLVRGMPREIPPPCYSMGDVWTESERFQVERMLRYSAVGSPETVARRLEAIVDETRADELILSGQIFNHSARLRSFEIAAQCGAGP
jgi:luciferase family oxidoreductase group 1